MSGPKFTSDSIHRRFERYLPIIKHVSALARFDLASAQAVCENERPGTVTRLINELVAQGWLLREGSAKSYRWNVDRGNFSPENWLAEKLQGRQVKGFPQQDRPRERLMSQGAAQMSNADLLAILVRSGRPGESAVTAGEKLAAHFADQLQQLPAASRTELKSISPAVEKSAYCQIMAGIELGRRVAGASESDRSARQISSSEDARAECQRRFARLAADGKQEEFHILTLNTKNRIINSHRITVGTLDASLVHPREVFRPAIKDAAASIILVHNHPSGDPTPSPQDFDVTRRLEQTGKTLGIEVLDHIIVGKQSAVSIREGT